MKVQTPAAQLLKSAVMVLVFALMVSFALPAQAGPTTAMQELRDYVQKTVPIDWKQGVDHARKTFPVVYAISMGWGMQSQKQHAGQDPVKRAQVEALKQEVMADLKSLSRECNYKDPQNGNPMQAEKLLAAFQDSMSGRLNDMARQTMKFNPMAIDMPYVAGGGTTEPVAKLQSSKKKIVLLGEEADPAAVADPKTIKAAKVQGQNLDGLICPMLMPSRSNKQLYWISSSSFRLPNKGVMNDKNNIYCKYYSNGKLSSQTCSALGEVIIDFFFKIKRSVYYLSDRFEQIDNGITGNMHYHGVKEQYDVSRNGQPYLWTREQWRNGKRNGKSEKFNILPSGKTFLEYDGFYVDDKKEGNYSVYAFDKRTEKIYLQVKSVYRQNYREKFIVYNPDGSVLHYGKRVQPNEGNNYRSEEIRNADGTLVSF